MQRSCYPERRLLPQQIVSSGPFWLLSLLYRPIGEFGEHPTNFFERGILADGAGNCISMGRADKHTDLMAKAMCLGRPVPAYTGSEPRSGAHEKAEIKSFICSQKLLL